MSEYFKKSVNNNQEAEGLLSPFLRNLRFRHVIKELKRRDIRHVLDLGCGAGHLSGEISNGIHYTGVDLIEFSDTSSPLSNRIAVGTGAIITADIYSKSGFDLTKKHLAQNPVEVDCITLLAVLEHLKDPSEFVRSISRLLSPGSAIIGTTPHPRGRSLHDWLAKLGICSAAGAEDHEKFLGYNDLKSMSEACELDIVSYDKFLVGLNQLFVLELR